MNKLIKILVGLIFIPNMIIAQFTMSGEFRPRTEYHHGYKNLANTDMDAKIFTNQRTRLNFDYKSEGYRVFVSLQDVRVWGTIPQLQPNFGVGVLGVGTYLHQAYAEMFLNKSITLKAGRQEIFYDDHRIFGHVGWAPQARSHDAFILKYAGTGFKADFGLSFNINANPAENYTDFQYLWLHKDFSMLKMSLLFLNNGVDYTVLTANLSEKRYSQTIGTRTGIKKGAFSAFVNFYYQTGAMGYDEVKINASLIGLDLSYKATQKMTLGLGFELQSGNDLITTNDENNAFSPFYGTNHKFNGHMDYFYVGNHFNNVGLQDIFGSFKYKQNKLAMAAVVHLFSSATEFQTDLSKNLGTEIDLSLGFPIAKGVSFKLGYSHMLGTESLGLLPDSNNELSPRGGDFEATSNWAWMMFSIKPTFFTSK